MRFLLALIIPFLAACEINHYKAVAANGNSVEESNWQLGGTKSARRSDGSSYANDYQQSFRDGAATAGLAIGAYQAVKVNNSNNALSATQSTNAATQATKINASNNALEAAKLKATPIIITPPQTVIFPP